jgi:glucosamine-6-phosphate deaminase
MTREVYRRSAAWAMMEVTMEVLTLPTAEEACIRAAEVVAQVVRARPDAALALPTGRTPVPIYAELVRRHRAGALTLGSVRAFGLDELWGVAASAAASFRRELDEAFYRHVDIAAANIHALDGAAADAAAEAAAYDAALGQAGGLDLALLGIGGNGHIAFNEPGSPFASRTRLIALAAETREAQRAAFGAAPVPTHALTIGIANILEARRVVLVATGAAKADVIARALEGPATETVPASVLRRHAAATILLDEAAASRLTAPHR